MWLCFLQLLKKYEFFYNCTITRFLEKVNVVRVQDSCVRRVRIVIPSQILDPDAFMALLKMVKAVGGARNVKMKTLVMSAMWGTTIRSQTILARLVVGFCATLAKLTRIPLIRMNVLLILL